MINKETYKKELVRMWDSVRTNSKGELTCSGVKCEDCPLYYVSVCHSYSSVNAYEVYEKAIKCINYVERWSKEHPPKHKVSQLEYDILEEANSTNVRFGFYIHIRNLLLKGYFKGATSDMLINDYLDNCEVEYDR